ncbi:MAG: hypothetical protein WCC59_13675 [Terriglobales bacterium]
MVEAQRITLAEERFCQSIRAKDITLRSFLEREHLSEPVDAERWLRYLTGIKNSLGNLNNDIGFVATLLVKAYLNRRFGVADFDAAGKAQGAPGIDIAARTDDGKTVVGELKTTKPYQPGFGAAQRASLLKDLARLASITADHRLMFVVDPDAYRALCKRPFSSEAPGVEIVDLVSGNTFLCV